MDTDKPGAGQLTEAVRQVLPDVRSDLERLIRIPSVSADPGAAPQVQASAAEVASLLRQAGLPEVEIVAVPNGQPAVLGHRPAPPGAPTVLLYAHHDVQPTGDPAGWDSDPFEPSERDGRLYGRGTADDKAGVAAHLAALRAHGDQLPVGVTVLVEGEEEIGSPTLSPFLTEYRDALRADVVVFADSANWTVDAPSLTISLRGAAPVVVEVKVLEHGVHSGLYGGPVPDALTALCRLLATLHDERGDVAVAGLTRGTTDPLDLTEAQLRADAAMLDGVELIGTGGLTERLWTHPAVTVIGIDAPSVEAASNTLIPAARAKVSLRVAPGDDVTRASQALAAHLEAHAPWGVHVTVQRDATAAPYSAPTGGTAYEAARWALAEAWGAPSIDTGGGGSIPFVTGYAELFPGAEILITGVEDPDTRAHGANESLHLATFERACLAEALLLHRLGEPTTEPA
jgi:acetylornithine deacetylase/succinyl-diaminopimelate desuccinylase-like protein